MQLNKQQAEILQILRQCGNKGMNSYDWRMKYIQLPVRIKELKGKCYLISTIKNKNRSVNYVLIDEPTAVLTKIQGSQVTTEAFPVADNSAISYWKDGRRFWKHFKTQEEKAKYFGQQKLLEI